MITYLPGEAPRCRAVVIEESYLRLLQGLRVDGYGRHVMPLSEVLVWEYGIMAGRAEETLEPIVLTRDAA